MESQKITIDQLIKLWNTLGKGTHKTIRVKTPYNEKNFLKLFEAAILEVPDLGGWELIIKETIRQFNEDEFWQSRQGLHSLKWLFQRRSKGQGEYNWIYYYELAMDRLDKLTEVKEIKDEYWS